MSLKIRRSHSARNSIRRSIRKKLRNNTHERLKDPTKFDAPDSDEEAWLDELFIKRSVITDITHRVRNGLLRSKEYVYQINVQWNIGKETVIYRSYDDFFRMQMHLLDFFGEDPESPDRSIPFLPGREIWRFNTRKLARSRQPKIQTYLDALLDLPYRISRCNEVLNFFRFRESDPKEILVPPPQELIFVKQSNNNNFIRNSFRRSFKKVRSKLTRTRSLRSMTDEEKARENNDNYDVEPTTAKDHEAHKVDKLKIFLQMTRHLAPPGSIPIDYFDPTQSTHNPYG